MNEKRVLVIVGNLSEKIEMAQITPFVEAVAKGSVMNGSYEVKFLNASPLRSDPEPVFKRGYNKAMGQLSDKKPKPTYAKMSEAPEKIDEFDIIILIGDAPDAMRSAIKSFSGKVLHLNGYGTGATNETKNWSNTKSRNPDQIPQILRPHINSIVESLSFAA